MRIIAACAIAVFATSAVAENLVMDDARIQYSYTYETLGSRHSCNFATVMGKAPMVIKLTAALITDDAKPKDQDITTMYVVEAFVVGAPKGSNKLEPKQIKVVGGRIISDIFNSDLSDIARPILPSNSGSKLKPLPSHRKSEGLVWGAAVPLVSLYH